MADINSNIFINIDTAQAMSALRALDKQLSAFNRSMVVGTRAAQAAQADFTRSLLHNVNATGAFTGSMAKMTTATDQFSERLERGRLSLREYYRYGMASTRTFGRFFGREFETVGNLVQKRVKTLQTQYVALGRDAQGAINSMSMTPKKLNYNDQLTRMSMVIQRQQILNKLLADGSVKLLNFGKNTQWAGRQLMVGFTIPLAMFAASAVKSFKEIETQALRFKKVYGDLFTTQDETETALKNMQKLADEFTKYGLKVAETIKTAAEAAAAGFAGNDLDVIVRQANKLAVLGSVAQDQSLETIIALKNAFGITTAELGKNIDFLNAVENQTVLTIEDLTKAIPRVAPVIKQLGGDVKDLSFFLTAMKEGGVSAEQGANALKSGLASLINPSTAAVKATSALGINLKAIVESNAGDLKSTVLEFAQSLSTLNDLQRGQIIEKIFGKYQFARLSAMFNNITKEGTQANRVMKLSVASAEELALLSQREMKLQESSSMNKMQAQIEKLKAAIAPVGELFAKVLTPVIEFFVKLFNKFNELPDGIKKIVTIIVAAVAGIGPVVLMTVGLVANGIANLMKMFNLVRQGYQRLAYGSKDAALNTRYMTQEELQNTAVTNALTTSHQSLSSAYILEASSLRALTAVYQQANAAMSVFARNNPGMFMPGMPTGGGRPPFRFNKGVSYVPGTGNKDTVPAVLTPGEAVIPKPMVAKYGGLVDAMVKDQIPGYMAGYYPSATSQVTRLLAGQPGVVGRAGGFGAAGSIGRSVAARRLATIQMSPSAVSSPIMQRVGLEEQGNLISVTMGGAQFFIKKSNYPNLEKFILENEKYSISKGASVDDIFARMISGVSAPHRKILGQTITPADLKKVLPLAPTTSAVTPGAKARRLSYEHKKQYKDLKIYFKEEEALIREKLSVQDLATMAAPRAKIEGERLKDAITRTGNKDLFYLSPALSHGIPAKGKKRTKFDDREENLYEETNQMNLAFAYNGDRQHVKNSAEARQFLQELSEKKEKTAFDRYAIVALQKRLKDGFYEKFITRQDDLLMANKGVLTPGGSYGNIPAVLTPGEAVLSKDVVKKYQPLITAMSEGTIPGYMSGVMLGMPGSFAKTQQMRASQAQLEAAIAKSRLAKTPPTDFGHLVQPFSGRSFPIPGVGGVYRKPNGDLVVVKPAVDEKSALAEIRATQIAREAHGLDSPKQSIKTMIDPSDPTGKRKLIVLESPYNKKFAEPTGKFTKQQYIKQLVAASLRGDKDLSMSNLSGNMLADVGTAGVFSKASGFRDFAKTMPSMEDQAVVNLLGVKGGAKRFFAEATAPIASKMSAQEFESMMLAEINTVLPKLKKTISSFKLGGEESKVYADMIARLEAGKKADWKKIHGIHTNVKPKKYKNGVVSVPGPKGAGDIMPAMLAPGEAVIPAKMTEKYSPLISGMINDSIPGFITGPGFFDPNDPWDDGTRRPLLGPDGRPLPPSTPGTRNPSDPPIPPRGPDRVERAIDKFFDKPGVKRFGEKWDKMASKFAKAGPPVDKLGQSVGDVGDTVKDTTKRFQADKTRGFTGWLTGYGKVSDTVENQDGSVRKATQAERTNMRQERRMASSGRMMGIGMASMMVPMIAGAAAAKNSESGFGKFASDNMMTIMFASMLPMLMPLFNAPWKKLALGVALLVGLYKMQSAQIKKSIQDGIAQGRSIGNSVENLEEFGKITGRMSSTQIQEEKRRRNALEISPVSQRFGAQFRNSEFGKKFIEDFTKNAQIEGVDAGQMLGTQLAGAVAQGVISNAQAESIIVNIARANKDQRLELDARATLRQIVGPDGQDLTTKPIEIQTKILLNNKEIQIQLQTAFANVVEAEMGGSKLGRILGLGTGINKSEAGQLGLAAIPGTAIGLRYGIKAAGATQRFIGGTGMVSEGIAAGRAVEGGKAKKLLTGVKTARAAALAASAGTGASGVGLPAAIVGAVVTTAILGSIEFGLRKYQQGQEKKKVGAVSGVVAGSSIQNLQAVRQGLDAISENEDIQLRKLQVERDIAKTAEKRLEIEQKMAKVQSDADKGRETISKQSGQVLAQTANFMDSITSDEARQKIKESFDIAYTDFFKNAVGAQKLSSTTVDTMLNPDAGLLKTSGLRQPADAKAVADAQKQLDENRAEIAKQQAILTRGGTMGEMATARQVLAKAERFTPLFEGMLAEAKKGKKVDVSKEQLLTFRAQIQSAIVGGFLNVESAQTLISTMNANGRDYTQALVMRLNVQGAPEVDRLGTVMSYLKDNDKRRVEIATAGMSGKELAEFNTGLEEIIKLPSDIEVDINLEVNGKQDIKSIKEFGKEVEAIRNYFPDGKVTKTTLQMYQKSIGGPGNNKTLDAGITDFKMIEKYSPELRLQAVVSLQQIRISDSFKNELNTEMQNEFRKLRPNLSPYVTPVVFAEEFAKWKASEQGKAFLLKIKPQLEVQKMDDMFAQIQAQIEADRRAAELAAAPKRDKSWLEDLLLRLKLLKESTINAKNGLKELEKYLGSKAGQSRNPNLDLEGRGLINQIETRAKNNAVINKKTGKKTAAPIQLSQDLMDFISGLDVDQLNFFIKDYLNTDKSGNVIGFKPGFEIINTAFKVEGIAVFLRNSKDTNTELEKQEALFNKLIDPLGQYKWNIEQAAWAMTDVALAGALMRKEQLSPAELKAANDEYARRVKILASGKSTDISQDISRTNNQIKTLTLLTKAGVNFNDALDISKVKEFADEIALAYGATDTAGQLTAKRAEEIRNKFKGYIQDVKDFRDAMFNLEQQSETRSDKLTDKFAAEQARITVAGMAAFRAANQMSVEQFNLVTKEKEALQESFQDQIEKYTEGITTIEKLEESVNKKYDEKIKLVDNQVEALSKVLSLNEDIAAQQQNQLTLADALTQGDISAAAKAAADYSAQQAEVASRSAGEALDAQRSAMEIAKQKEIDNLTASVNGKLHTKKQITEEITKIQETFIDPLVKEIDARNKLVAAFELGIEKQLKLIEIQGLTADEWGSIKDAVVLLNDAYDAQILDIDSMAASVTGVAGAWKTVSDAIVKSGNTLGSYPQFKQEVDKSVADKLAADKLAEDKLAADRAAEAAKVSASALAAKESGAIGAASIAAQLKAALDAQADAAEKAKIAAMRAPAKTSAQIIAERKQKFGYLSRGGMVPRYMPMGGLVPYMSGGGMFKPKGTDTVPAMLTPGEFVVRKSIADQYGQMLEALNNGKYTSFDTPTYSSMSNNVKVGLGAAGSSANNSSKVYNYNVGINVNNTNAGADDIAKAVMSEIKYIDSQRLRGQR
jgi:TP901 family phage tail tape measure protein